MAVWISQSSFIMVESAGSCLDLEWVEACWGRPGVLKATVGEVMTAVQKREG